MRLPHIPKLRAEEWILAGMFVAGFLLIPSPWGREFLLYKQLIMAVGILLLSLINFRRKQVNLPLDWITVVFAAFVGLHFCSVLWADHPTKVLKVASTWLMLFLFYLNVRAIDVSTFNKAFWKWSVWLITGIFILSILGFIYRAGFSNDGFKLAQTDIQYVGKYLPHNGNYTASLLLMLIPVLFFFKEKNNRIGTYVLMGAASFFIFMFQSKASIIGLMLLIIMYIFRQKNKILKRKIISGTLIGIGIVIISIFFLLDQQATFFQNLNPLHPLFNSTGDDRLLLWQKSLQLWKQHPILGIGSGNWMTAFLQFGIGEYAYFKNYMHAHNLVVETCAELGGIGGVCISMLLLGPFVTFFKKYSTSQIPSTLYAILFTYLVVSLFYGVVYGVDGRFSGCQYIWVWGLAVWASLNQKKTKYIPINIAVILISIFCMCLSACYVNQHWKFKAYTKAFAYKKPWKADRIYPKLHIPYLYEFILNKHIPGIHGNMLMKSKQYEKAVLYLEKSTQRSPYEYQNWETLGACYSQLSDYDNAIKAYTSTLTLNPKNIEAAYQLALISFHARNWQSFEKGTSVYYNHLLPIIETRYDPESWFEPRPKTQSYGNFMCGFQDKFILLIDKKDSLFQSERRME